MGKKLSGAAKRKKQKENEKAFAEAAADLERLKLGPTALWTGLVLHHKDIFVSHVLPKLNESDRHFFGNANTESWDLLEYAGVDVSKNYVSVNECSSISTLEFLWNNIDWGDKLDDGTVVNEAWFIWQIAMMNKLEFLKWAREEKKCELDEWTINAAALVGNLEMLNYCFANDCPYYEEESCGFAARNGHLDCLRFLLDKVKPSRETEQRVAYEAAQFGQLDILKYCVEERKISDDVKANCVTHSVYKGNLDCLKYLVEEAKTPLNHWPLIVIARYYEQTECLRYLREKGWPEPTDEQYRLEVIRLEEHERLCAREIDCEI